MEPHDYSTTEHAYVGTGETYETPPMVDKIPPYDPKLRQHYWVLLVAFGVDPRAWKPDSMPSLNSNNLAQIAPPGCYYCERAYTKQEGLRTCRGEPR